MPAAHPDEFGPHTRDDALADDDRYRSVEHAEGGNAVAPVPGELRRRLLRREAEVGELPGVEPTRTRGPQASEFRP
jgi:hypothetical protein